jgi:hypothetical protein
MRLKGHRKWGHAGEDLAWTVRRGMATIVSGDDGEVAAARAVLSPWNSASGSMGFRSSSQLTPSRSTATRTRRMSTVAQNRPK